MILGVLVLAGVLVAVCRREREPEYGGKRLSEWVENYVAYASLPSQTDEAAGAIRQTELAAIC